VGRPASMGTTRGGTVARGRAVRRGAAAPRRRTESPAALARTAHVTGRSATAARTVPDSGGTLAGSARFTAAERTAPARSAGAVPDRAQAAGSALRGMTRTRPHAGRGPAPSPVRRKPHWRCAEVGLREDAVLVAVVLPERRLAAGVLRLGDEPVLVRVVLLEQQVPEALRLVLARGRRRGDGEEQEGRSQDPGPSVHRGLHRRFPASAPGSLPEGPCAILSIAHPP
jgi:hypothetical protein